MNELCEDIEDANYRLFASVMFFPLDIFAHQWLYYWANARFICSHKVLFTVCKLHPLRWYMFNKILLQHQTELRVQF